MLFRALFWIGIVALLMPHEPDLGLGRPGTGFVRDAFGMAKDAAGQSSGICGGRESLCAAAFGLLSSVQQNTVRNLAQVKAQLEAQQRDRARGAAG